MDKLDIHGVKHKDVSRELDVFFWDMMQKDVSDVEVITGNSQIMKDLVMDTCEEYGFKVKEVHSNPGCLIVILK